MDNLNCPECGKTFETGYALSSHRNQEHGTVKSYQEMQIQAARKKIKRAYVAGYVSAGFTTIVAILGLLGSDAWSLIDAAIFFGLSWGISKNNRACAVAMFVIWILEKAVQVVQSPISLTGLPVAIIFGYLFYGGISGTFEYRRIIGSGSAIDK